MAATILLSNDDGIDAPGLAALERALKPLGDVWVVAPDGERSTSSHILTLHQGIPVHDRGGQRFAVGGWPADCAYLGLFALVPKWPDIVVSGINRGPNLGTDVVYSGTVAAAREAFSRGVPAIAVSLDRGDDFSIAARIAASLVREVLEAGKPLRLLNLNVPEGEPKGIEVTSLGKRKYPETAVLEKSEDGVARYRIGTGVLRDAGIPGTDGAASAAGFASITPLQIDTTNENEKAAILGIASQTWERMRKGEE